MVRLGSALLCLSMIACGPPTPTGGGGSARTRCDTNDDCRADFDCDDGRCVRRTGSPAVDAGVAPSDAGMMTDASIIEPETDAGEVQPADCGNGVLDGEELCDDGNRDNTDGCLNSCVPASCGDGVIRVGVEQCDDGNLASGDGCSADCMTEEVEPVCGNGVVEAGEQCDDGNRSNGDGCDSECQTETPQDQDHGDTPEEAMRITVPASVEASLFSGTDRDYFRFFATGTGVYMIETTGSTDTVCSVLFNGNPLATDDDSGVVNNCAIQQRLDAGRTYHIRVSGSGGATGAYVLQVNR